MRIDAHQHFWKYSKDRHVWMTEDMQLLKVDHLPPDLKPHLDACSMDGCVAVQADQSEDENTFLLGLAEEYSFIKGVVGWVDLKDPGVEARLSQYAANPKLKGFRHVLQDEPQRDYMLDPSFVEGVGLLRKYHLTYDLLVFPDQLGYTLDFLRQLPDQPFVVDHIAKPPIKDQKMGDWNKHMTEVAAFDNVYCKISGLVTEADWAQWKKEDFHRYLDIVVEQFGVHRIMYGSDWPVCQLAASYQQQFDIVADYFSTFTESEQALFFGSNAVKFYQL